MWLWYYLALRHKLHKLQFSHSATQPKALSDWSSDGSGEGIVMSVVRHRHRRVNSFLLFRGQQFLDPTLDAEAASLALLQPLLQSKTHKVFPSDDSNHPVCHVHHRKMAQTQCAEDYVSAV